MPINCGVGNGENSGGCFTKRVTLPFTVVRRRDEAAESTRG